MLVITIEVSFFETCLPNLCPNSCFDSSNNYPNPNNCLCLSLKKIVVKMLVNATLLLWKLNVDINLIVAIFMNGEKP